MLKSSAGSPAFCRSHRQQVVHRDGEFIFCVMAEIFTHERGIEAVKSRGDRRMSSKQVSRAGDGHGKIERCLVILHVAACSFENRKRCVTLVKMAYLGL